MRHGDLASIMVSVELLPAGSALPALKPAVDTGFRDRAIQTQADVREVTGMTVSPLDHYQVLMLDREADTDLLTTVYRRLVQRYQSSLDRSGTALQRLQAVAEAYSILGDPQRRARYDAQLEDRMWDDEPAAPAAVPQPITPPVARAVAPAPARTVVPVGGQRPSATRSVQVSVLDFGRYAGWTLRQLAARDPDYLEWLLRSPGGRQYHAEITALLQPR